jgi:hypothetical protein
MAIERAQAADVYRERFDGLIVRTRDLANRRSTGPALRRDLLDLVDELARLRRDLSGLEGAPLTALPAAPATRPPNNGGQRTGTQRIGRAWFRPPDGQRYCGNHDDGAGALLPIHRFGVKNAKTGQRWSWCDDCRRQYQRDRYVNVKAKTIAVELLEGDKCVGHDCPDCGLPFEIGDKVQGENLRHERCG